MNQKNRKSYLKAKLIENGCTREELRELYFLISQSGSSDENDSLIEQIWNQEQTIFSGDEKADKIRFNKIRRKIELRPHSLGFSWNALLKVAASIAIISSVAASVFFLVTFQPTEKVELITKATEQGQRAIIQLSDGTIVTLNAESSISYPIRFSGESREVKLIGEAFFDVVKDENRPFSVEAAGLVTRVLGTSFNIKAYDDEETVDVTVATGKVKIVPKEALVPSFSGSQSNMEKGAKILMPNQQASFNPVNRTITVKEVKISPYLAWTSNTLHFDMVPFTEVVNTLQQWYDIEVELKNPEAGTECLVRAKYEKESLETVLNGLQLLVDFEYKFINHQKIIITMKKCKYQGK